MQLPPELHNRAMNAGRLASGRFRVLLYPDELLSTHVQRLISPHYAISRRGKRLTRIGVSFFGTRSIIAPNSVKPFVLP
jgi:hypothetical protein